MKNLFFLAASSLSILVHVSPALAVGAVERPDEIFVSDTRRDALAEAQAAAESRPGNVEVVPAEAYNERYAVTLRDALAFSPGVVMQSSFGEDGRLSVRGSGLAQNFHLRGVELLINGVPINAADGFGDFQEMDVLFASHINVLRGANAMSVGAAGLGGAVEIRTLTAETVPHDFMLRAEGGSFGTSRLNASAAGSSGRFDALIAGTWQRQDGFRDHAQQRNERFYANVGARWSENAETRIGVFVNDIDQEIAGSVSLAAALDDPKAAAPANIAQNWQRDMKTVRAFATTTINVGDGVFSFGGSYAHKDLYHPIIVFILQESDDYTGFARYERKGDLAGVPVEFVGGMRYRFTDLDSGVFGNFGGAQGPAFSVSRQRSESVEAYAEARAEILPGLEAIAGLNYITTVRNYDDKINDLEDARLRFKETSPRFGLLYRPTKDVQVFANASASYEPPTFNELTQSGIVGFTPINAQDGFTFEIGARGELGRLDFEAAIYRADLDGEFVAFTTIPGVPAPIFNADNTRHQGIEAYLSFAAVDDWRGVSVTPRIAYTLNDFNFVNDPVYGDNRLAGLPTHIGRAEIEFSAGGFRIAPNFIFQSGDNFVDYANTLQSPGHTLIGIEAAYDIAPSATIFVDARNLADRGYVSNYSTLADAGAASNLNVFVPGEGRAVFAGVRIGFGGDK